jgi:hypothetical protein
VPLSVILNATRLVQLLAEIDEASHEKVQTAVVVVIEPNSAGPPTGGGHARFLRHVREGAVAVVVVEEAAPVLRDVQIRKTASVVIANRDALSESAGGNPGFFCNVGEGSISVVFVKRVSQRRIGREEIAFAAVH